MDSNKILKEIQNLFNITITKMNKFRIFYKRYLREDLPQYRIFLKKIQLKKKLLM